MCRPAVEACEPSMKVPPKRKGNLLRAEHRQWRLRSPLNESPSEKEGKSHRLQALLCSSGGTSMKALPTRKGDLDLRDVKNRDLAEASMKALPKRKGNRHHQSWRRTPGNRASMKAPPKRMGNSFAPPAPSVPARGLASIKDSPKRKGNWKSATVQRCR